jgi:type I restriction enzyme S subunit
MGQALFNHYFVTNPEAKRWDKIALGRKIKPRRGKSLQSKNMKQGSVFVISGGLQPAGLHNESNTVAPVITVSASGANAGFTALWGHDVWSADSSFIDTTITPHVYFYYLFLSSNQKRIYEMQTGSGQPHIYPSHLELLELPDAPEKLIDEFNGHVAANFEKIERNKQQIQTLTTLRDTLLPRLINGKISL